jgi:hypothetical protein
VVQLPSSTFHYKEKPKDDSEVIEALNTMAEKHLAVGL